MRMYEIGSRAVLCSILVCQPLLAAPEGISSNGEDQLALILRDRPKLAVILKSHAFLRDWVVREFDGTSGGLRPLWDPSEPVSGRAAEHEYPSRGRRAGKVADGTVVFRVSARRTGWDQLTGLVFELHNFRGSRRFEEIHRAAVSGTIDKSAYVRQIVEQELIAVLATKEFLRRNVLSLPGAGRDESTLFWRLLNSEDSLDGLIQEYKRRGHDLKEHYEKLYEDEVVPEMRGGSDDAGAG